MILVKMFEKIKIILLGHQPVLRISTKELNKLIHREFPENINEIKDKFQLIKSDSIKDRNRISVAIIKLSYQNINAVDELIQLSNSDYRDIISKAEYPEISEIGFNGLTTLSSSGLKKYYLRDWENYIDWIKKRN